MTLAEEAPTRTRREHSAPVLVTERLKLRSPHRDDAAALARLANDRRIAANMLRLPLPYGIDDARRFIDAGNDAERGASFVIIFDGAPIGACGVELRDDGPELGFWLGAPFWSRGLATEAARAVIDYAFGELQHETLQAGARVTNPASRRVLEKCGFQWSSVRLSRVRAINSAAPFDRFRLDRGLWLSLKRWGGAQRVA
jgi:RimJ/RimL family protein N-acetyltransferase